MQEWFNAETVFAITKQNAIKEHFYINRYKRDNNGNIIFKNGIPQQENILKSGKYDYSIVEIPFNDGSPDAKIKAWGEIMKTIEPQYAKAALPAIMRDMGSPQAEEMAEIIKQVDEAQQAQNQNNEANNIQLAQMQLQIKQMEAKIAELVSKANLNNAKAQEIATNANLQKE